ncbi:MAG: sulfatase-like hydrolase/transferase [Dichotomicrobium sp.]
MVEASRRRSETRDAPVSSRRSRIAWDGSWPLHPFLFAAASVMTMMAGNLNHTSFGDVLHSLAYAILFALAVYLVAALVRRRFDRLSAVIASVWVVGCLYYAGLFGPLESLLQDASFMVNALPFALAALALVTALAFVLRRAMVITHYVLTGIAAALLAQPVWQAAAYEWRNGAAREAYDPGRAMAEIAQYLPAGGLEAATSRTPDIYHFVFDRYASEGILRRHYDFDNSAIGSFLEQRGFYVARASNSNYQKTGHSLASAFYMDYLDFLERDERVTGRNWHPIYAMLDDHRVARMLKSSGYDIIQFGSWWVGTYDNPVADENHPHGFSEFEMLYLRRTALGPLFQLLPDTPLTMRLDWDNAQCQRVGPQVEQIKALAAREREQPVYVFAHILVPHGPYVFAPDGRCLGREEAMDRGKRQGYIDQIAYANRIIEEVVTALQDRGVSPPIILIQADEGPFPQHDPEVAWQDKPTEKLRIKTGILNAIYFPNGDYGALRNDITLVNSYRVLFNSYFGAEFPLLPDRIFAFPNYRTLYEFHDVTEKVRGPATVAAGGQEQ